MATQTVEIVAPAGLSSVTLKLFDEGSDTVVQSVLATPGTNDPSLYSAAFTDAPAARYRAVLFSGSDPVVSDHVTLTLTTATFRVEGMQGLPVDFGSQWARVYAVEVTGVTVDVEGVAGRHSNAATVLMSTNGQISGGNMLAKKPSDNATLFTFSITTSAAAENITGIS